MDLTFSDEQLMLQDMTRRLCSDFAPFPILRKVEGTEPGYSLEFWRALIDAGITGLTVEPAFGGLGLGAIESMIVHEEFGRGLAVSPHLVSSLLAADLISAMGDPQQRLRWLPPIADGKEVLSVATLEQGEGFDISSIQCRASRTLSGFRLSGKKHFVPYAASAKAVLVLAKDGAAPDGVIALIVDLTSPGISMRYQPNHAGEALYQIDFSDVDVAFGDALNGGKDLTAAWNEAMYAALIAVAAQAVGGAAKAHEVAVSYAKVREAFGKPIGAFQAIAHSLADVAVELEGCRMLVRQAAWAKDQGYAFRRLATIAKLQACEMYRRAAAVTIQVHGGMGYTLDADPQLFFRRAKHLQLLNWDSDFLEERIVALSLEEVADPGRRSHV
ncbi:MAG: acyl-CoA dehydrogenase family protein [Pseudomonadota bacterium]